MSSGVPFEIAGEARAPRRALGVPVTGEPVYEWEWSMSRWLR